VVKAVRVEKPDEAAMRGPRGSRPLKTEPARSYAPAVPEFRRLSMPVVAVFQHPTLTKDKYDESVIG
jgi:hypothetical protein